MRNTKFVGCIIYLADMVKIDRTKSIKHTGRVEKVDPGSVTVKIISGAACSGCHAEGYCSLSGNVEKNVKVKGSYNFSPGDKVTVEMKQSMGYNAVLIGYIIPFILLITSLIVFISVSIPEATAGLLSIGVLVPYYLAIYLFRKKIDENFIFTIKN